jgi:hypothetical protein
VTKKTSQLARLALLQKSTEILSVRSGRKEFLPSDLPHSGPNWDDPVFNLVNWPTFHAAMLHQSFLKCFFMVKWVNHLLPFEAQQFKFKQPFFQLPVGVRMC